MRLWFAFILGLLLLGSLGFAVTPFSACGTTMNVAGETYSLTTDITAVGDCLTIGAQNITIQGNGYTITRSGAYSNSTGISSNYWNTTISSIILRNFNPAISFGSSANYSTIYNTTIRDVLGLKSADGAAGTIGSCGYANPPGGAVIFSNGGDAGNGTNGSPVIGVMVNSSYNTIRNNIFINITGGNGSNGGKGGDGGSCTYGYCSYSCVGQGGNGGNAGSGADATALKLYNSENNNISDNTFQTIARGMAGTPGAYGCGGGGANIGYCHLGGGTNGAVGATGNNSTIYVSRLDLSNSSMFWRNNITNVFRNIGGMSYGFYLNSSSNNAFFRNYNTGSFFANSAQNTSSYENTGFWPTITSTGSDATNDSNTTNYTGAPSSYWFNSTYSPTVSTSIDYPSTGSLLLNKTVQINYSIAGTFTTWINTSLYVDGVLKQSNITSSLAENYSYTLDLTIGTHTINLSATTNDTFSNYTYSTSSVSSFTVGFVVSNTAPANGATLSNTETTYEFSTNALYNTTCRYIINGAEASNVSMVPPTSTASYTADALAGTVLWHISCAADDNTSYVVNSTQWSFATQFITSTDYYLLTNYTEAALFTPQRLFYDMDGYLNTIYYTQNGTAITMQIRTLNGSSLIKSYSIEEAQAADFFAVFRMANSTILSFDKNTGLARFTQFGNNVSSASMSTSYLAGSNSYYDPYEYAHTKQFSSLSIGPSSYFLFVLPSSSGSSLVKVNATLNESGVTPIDVVQVYTVPANWQTIANSSDLMSWYYAKPTPAGAATNLSFTGDMTYTPGVPNDVVSGSAAFSVPFYGGGAVSGSVSGSGSGNITFIENVTKQLNLSVVGRYGPCYGGTSVGLTLTNGTHSISTYASVSTPYPGGGASASNSTVLNFTKTGSTISATDGITTLNFAAPTLQFNWSGSASVGSCYASVDGSVTATATFDTTQSNYTIVLNSYNGSTQTAVKDLNITYNSTEISNSKLRFDAYEGSTYALVSDVQNSSLTNVNTGKSYVFNQTLLNASRLFFIDNQTMVFFDTSGGTTYASSCYFGDENATCTRLSSTDYGYTAPYTPAATSSKRTPNILTGFTDRVTAGSIGSNSTDTLLYYTTYDYDLKVRCMDEINYTRYTTNIRVGLNASEIAMKQGEYIYGFVFPSDVLGSGIKKIYSYCPIGTSRMYVFDPTNVDTYSLLDAAPNAYYTFLLTDCYGQVSRNALVTAERFMTDIREYKIVEQAYSSLAGDAVLFLQPFIPYRLTITAEDGVTVTQGFTPGTLASISIPLACAGEEFNVTPDYNQIYDDLGYNVMAKDAITGALIPSGGSTNRSFNMTFNISSASGRIFYANFLVYRSMGDGLSTLIYNDTSYITTGDYRSIYINSSTGAATYNMLLTASVLNLDENNTNNTYVNSTSRATVTARNSVSLKVYGSSVTDLRTNLHGAFGSGGGWAWLFIVTILTMLLIGYVSRFTLDGAGLIGAGFFIGMALLNPVSIMVGTIALEMWQIGAIAMIAALLIVVWRYV